MIGGAAFGKRQRLAGGFECDLRAAPAGARIGLRGLGRAGLRFGLLDMGSTLAHFGAHSFDLALDLGQMIAAGEPTREAGRGIGGDREAVPTPEVAFFRHEPLARREF